MKINRILLLIWLLPFISHAGYTVDLTDPKELELADIYPSFEVMRSLNFNDTQSKMTMFGFKSDKESDDYDVIFYADISSDKNGKQRIYITTSKSCDNSDEPFETIRIKTNGQNVRYKRFCNGSYIYITPMSAAGSNYLRDEFMKKDDVVLAFSDIFVIFDATGFTKAWNNYGGDAL